MFSVLYLICPHTQQTLSYFFLSFFMFCKTNILSLFFVLFYNFSVPVTSNGWKLVMTCFAMTMFKTVKHL